jgi:amino acid transporter/mannitol/fructose-specific phosphotransferase system IIA component (Ntr-type)/nucleotide-binding universal stress UspA family protein
MKTLERRLGLGAVIAISISAMLGSGIFVLPGLAAAKTGPSVWLAYLVAGLCVLPAAISKSELATAMPTSGGTYVYLERAFGPLAGTVSGIGLWLSLLLKSAFALVGFGAYLAILVDIPIRPLALTLLFVITVLNLFGVSIIGKLQKFIVAVVVLSLGMLCLWSFTSIDWQQLDSGFDKGVSGFIAATAFVYISYAGVTKVAAIAEEVKHPDRNLPLGMLLSWLIVTVIYVSVVFVLVAIVPMSELTDFGDSGKPNLHPIYTLAMAVGGRWIGIAAAVLAVITMVSMAVAGLLAASRFPFAMSRDELLPPWVRHIHSRLETPVASILLTAGAMGAGIWFLPVEEIAKLASSFKILAFMSVCGSVIVLREYAALWYQPRFRSPLYPWLQLLGVALGIVLLGAMGWTGILAIVVVLLLGAVAYFVYGRRHTSHRGVLGKMGVRSDLLSDGDAAAAWAAADSATAVAAASEIAFREIDEELGGNVVVSLEEELPTEASVVVPLFGNERSPEMLVEMGAAIARGQRVEVLYIKAVPEQMQLADVLEDDSLALALQRRLHTMAEEEQVDLEIINTVSRDVVKTVHSVADRLHCEWVVMAEAGRRDFGVTFQNPLGWLTDHLPARLAVFKDAGIRYIRQILVYAEPGPHDALVVSTADHLAQVYEAELNFVCFLGDTTPANEKQARVDYVDQIRDLCESTHRVVMLTGTSELAAIEQSATAYDLLVMGAPADRTRLGRIMGSAKDNLTRRVSCSVLWLKTPRYQSHLTFELGFNGQQGEFDLIRHLHEDLLAVNAPVKGKEALFRLVSGMFVAHLPDLNEDQLMKAFWEREQMQNTAVGNGIALPHATLSEAASLESAVAVVTTAEPIDYGVAGGGKVDVFFVTIGAAGDRQTHLKILSAIARLNLDASAMQRIRQTDSEAGLWATLQASVVEPSG